MTHLGSPGANAPRAYIHLDYSDSQIPSSEDYPYKDLEYPRLIFFGFGILLTTVLLLAAPRTYGQADPQPSERSGSKYREWSDKGKEEGEKLLEKAKEGKKGPIAGTHYYWYEGLHIVSRRENFRLKIGGTIILDGGYIDANKDLERAFPDLEGYGGDFRALSVSVAGTIRALSAVNERVETTEKTVLPGVDAITPYARYDALAFKFEIDSANLREIKDIWLRFPSIPLLRYFKFGHMKEPFSLERSTSLTNITFMEWALPNEAFAASRNIGIRFDKPVLGERMTLGGGGFLNTGSFSDVGEANDRMSDANGYNFTGRITGLPWYGEEGKRLLHLGLSYSHGVRNDKDIDDHVQFRARPESRLTGERSVDTDGFLSDRLNMINPEFAIVSGPLSLQGEYFHTFTDADAEGDPRFWGFYVYGSYFVTGEHRNYDTSRGVFSRVRPERNFHPLEGGWGGLELGLRFSYVDLNDEAIKGGKESNFTAGLNWYLTPHVRLMINYIWAKVKDRATPPAVDDGRANIFQARFQLAF